MVSTKLLLCDNALSAFHGNKQIALIFDFLSRCLWPTALFAFVITCLISTGIALAECVIHNFTDALRQ